MVLVRHPKEGSFCADEDGMDVLDRRGLQHDLSTAECSQNGKLELRNLGLSGRCRTGLGLKDCCMLRSEVRRAGMNREERTNTRVIRTWRRTS